ncbi:citrate transporter [Sphingomonas paucimobilis]|uniref:Anion permease n=2 Tax=Sphingomonas paucimobilis TaxID=13689 RepID=A0A411LGR4_SPHPI|nr:MULTISPECIES: SLC13 family permease [Sphingomonas]MBQ1481371.1 anion permease [Sphingomonas sp.]MCM3679513.1 SLC13 family permease [Sphingomonas paucimobilis]MDG5972228.1 anion permease [Sphingomonas paucimobilis]NNG57791.1 citrate transporter [Sphingomonas paucimobilis]QBE91511.1 citrate transporter [Sphingomonas paucimobilis]
MGLLGAWSELAAPALLTIATIGLWANARLPEYLTALLFFAAAMVLAIAPAEVVFSGFLSAAFWLVLSGFVLGVAIRKVGLADRTARLLAAHLSDSWPRMVGGVILLTYLLAFVMPSNMGRITLLMPVVMALADRTGLVEGSRGRIGLALAVGFGTFQLSASILPANVPNLVMAGAAERAYGVHLTYLSYLVLQAPILGILKGLILTVCIVRLFPAAPLPSTDVEKAKPWSIAERRMALVLGVTLLFWMTDAWHGIQPAWIGLAAACFCLLPGVGFLNSDEFAAEVNIRTCLYIAGILGLAAVVVNSGLGNTIGKALLPWLPLDPASPGASLATLAALPTLLNFIVTANGVPALFTPLARSLAEGSGMPLLTVLMLQVIGYATPLLPYQASPIVVAMGMEKVPARDGLRLCLTMAVATFGLLLPLYYAWFRLLNWIP